VTREEAKRLTILWFLVWLVADLIGDREALVFDPVNWWTGTLLAALAIDLNRPQVTGRGGKQTTEKEAS
jgi:hypothetical protein